MKNSSLLGFGVIIFALVLVGPALADSVGSKTGPVKPGEVKAVNVGNKICPVMGVEINDEYKVTYEYEGKIYNFCCPGCIEQFKKDPEKFVQKVKEQS